jgi:hypothetical protein
VTKMAHESMHATNSAAPKPAQPSGGVPGRSNSNKVNGPTGPTPTDAKIDADRRARVGNKYIDDGAAHAANSNALLKADQRGRLIDNFQKRILRAEMNYQKALAQIRVDKLLEKEEDLSWVTSLLLDAMGMVFIGAVSKALMAVRNATAQSLANKLTLAAVNLETVRPGTELFNAAIAKVDLATIQAVVGAGAGAGKAAAAAKAKASQNKNATDDKTATVSYIDFLTDSASVSFQELSENAPAQFDDAGLIVLWESFAVDRHLVSVYVQQMTAKIERFRSSGTAQIGRVGNAQPPKGLGADNENDASGVRRDTRLVWLMFASGEPKQLWYESVYRRKFMNVPMNGAAFGEDSGDRFHEGTIHERSVPDEFREVAIARHTAVWGEIPDTLIDESNWTHDPARAKRARENMVKFGPKVKPT